MRSQLYLRGIRGSGLIGVAVFILVFCVASSSAQEKPKRAAHFDSDFLFEILNKKGIKAEFGGDLLLKSSLLGMSSSSGLSEVLMIYVEKPLSKKDEEIVATVAAQFFLMSQNWNYNWLYQAIAWKQLKTDNKLKIIKIDYSVVKFHK
ncbi:MAG: hypothetical protein ACUZ8I_10680 [Candidatus Scalindua sp.]